MGKSAYRRVSARRRELVTNVELHVPLGPHDRVVLHDLIISSVWTEGGEAGADIAARTASAKKKTCLYCMFPENGYRTSNVRRVGSKEYGRGYFVRGERGAIFCLEFPLSFSVRYTATVARTRFLGGHHPHIHAPPNPCRSTRVRGQNGCLLP